MTCKRPAIAATLALGLIQAGPPDTPPVAQRIEHREERHGATVMDNYFWLRDKSNPAVIEYLKSENAYTDALTKNLKPFEEALYHGNAGPHQADRSLRAQRGTTGTSTIREPKRASNIPSNAGAKAAWKHLKKSCWTATNWPQDTLTLAWALSGQR